MTGRPRSIRALLVVAIAVAIAILAVRVAFVRAYSDTAPTTAARLWSGHPAVAVGVAMEGIGRAAAQRRDAPPESLAAMTSAARVAPLTPEPFLVRGILARQAGDVQRAERAFVAARLRAPRQPAPRYFLAELYLAGGRGADGLRELATLARLLPQGRNNVAPAVAAFARTPGAEAQLRPIFRADPLLAQTVLAELAKDPANVDLILSLAEPARPGAPTPRWIAQLLNTLLASGQFSSAHDVWRTVSGTRSSRDSIFDPAFEGRDAPPPFNWTFAEGSVGLAEPGPGGTLRVIYYGRQDGALASQMMVLPPGRYRLAFAASGNAGSALQWTVTCLPVSRRVLNLPLDRAAGDFAVAPDCQAQLLELAGTSGDVAREVETAISRLSLVRTGP